MKKSLLISSLLLSFLSSSHSLFSQDRDVTLAPVQVVADVLPIMIHAEIKLADKQSFTFGGGLAFSTYFESFNGESNFEFYTTPFLTSSIRDPSGY